MYLYGGIVGDWEFIDIRVYMTNGCSMYRYANKKNTKKNKRHNFIDKIFNNTHTHVHMQYIYVGFGLIRVQNQVRIGCRSDR